MVKGWNTRLSVLVTSFALTAHRCGHGLQAADEMAVKECSKFRSCALGIFTNMYKTGHTVKSNQHGIQITVYSDCSTLAPKSMLPQDDTADE